jgi:hypothetical protein
MVANGKPGMAPSDIDSLKQKADELDQQLEKLTDKMEEIVTAQQLIKKIVVNSAACGMNLWIISTTASLLRPSNLLMPSTCSPCPITWTSKLPVKFLA